MELETSETDPASWQESFDSTREVSTYLRGVQAGMAMLGIYLTGLPSVPE
ncbi:hypothetical protein HY375_00840 [Candidatus Berkelbacteria bacterium]|nr:hypothetical protein [Candidatus Berkelbacteria bacterium]